MRLAILFSSPDPDDDADPDLTDVEVTRDGDDDGDDGDDGHDDDDNDAFVTVADTTNCWSSS